LTRCSATRPSFATTLRRVRRFTVELHGDTLTHARAREQFAADELVWNSLLDARIAST
jgi:hypothetical protein